MSDFLDILLHARRLKKATSDLSYDELVEAKSKLEKIIEEREGEEEARREAEAAKLQKIEEIQRLMQEAGVSPDELGTVAAATKAKTTSRKVAPKYRIFVEGVEYNWTGRGRKPFVFEQALAAGKSLDDFLIND